MALKWGDWGPFEMALTVFSQNLFSTSYRSSRHFFATREKNSKVPNMYSFFIPKTY